MLKTETRHWCVSSPRRRDRDHIPDCTWMCVYVAVCSSLNTELEREKVIRAEAEAKQNELQANEAQQQQKIVDLEGQIRDLEATKVSTTIAIVFLSVIFSK